MLQLSMAHPHVIALGAQFFFALGAQFFHKIEFSFLNGNLMVPEVGRRLNGVARVVRALSIVEGDEPWVLPTSPSLRC
jgi:hypothetical protein